MAIINPDAVAAIDLYNLLTDKLQPYFCELTDNPNDGSMQCKTAPNGILNAQQTAAFTRPPEALWGDIQLTNNNGIVLIKTSKFFGKPIQAEFTIGNLNSPNAGERPVTLELQCSSVLEESLRNFLGCTKTEANKDKPDQTQHLSLTPLQFTQGEAQIAQRGYEAEKRIITKQQEKLQKCPPAAAKKK